jgi:hypothetical protein
MTSFVVAKVHDGLVHNRVAFTRLPPAPTHSAVRQGVSHRRVLCMCHVTGHWQGRSEF